jgi:hypothetical protein
MNGDIEKASKVQELLKRWSELIERKRLLGWPHLGSNEQIIEETQILQALVDSGYTQIIPDGDSSVPDMLEARKRVLQERRDKYS